MLVSADVSGVQTRDLMMTARHEVETSNDDELDHDVSAYRAFDEESFNDVLTYYGSNANNVQVRQPGVNSHRCHTCNSCSARKLHV